MKRLTLADVRVGATFSFEDTAPPIGYFVRPCTCPRVKLRGSFDGLCLVTACKEHERGRETISMAGERIVRMPFRSILEERVEAE